MAPFHGYIRYIEFIQNTVFAPGSLPISFKGSDHCTMIDSTTAKLLELVGLKLLKFSFITVHKIKLLLLYNTCNNIMGNFYNTFYNTFKNPHNVCRVPFQIEIS